MSIIQQYLTEGSAYNRRGLMRNLRTLGMPGSVFAGLFRTMRQLRATDTTTRQVAAARIAPRYAEYDAMPDTRYTPRIVEPQTSAPAPAETPKITATGGTVRLAGRGQTRTYALHKRARDNRLVINIGTARPMWLAVSPDKIEFVNEVEASAA